MQSKYVRTPYHLLSKNNVGLRTVLAHAKQLQNLQNHLFPLLPEKLRNHVNIVNFEKGVLILGCETAGFLTALRHTPEDLLTELRKQKGFHGITSIKYTVQKHKAPEKKKKEPRVAISRTQAKHISETADNIQHVGLKASLKRLAKN